MRKLSILLSLLVLVILNSCSDKPKEIIKEAMEELSQDDNDCNCPFEEPFNDAVITMSKEVRKSLSSKSGVIKKDSIGWTGEFQISNPVNESFEKRNQKAGHDSDYSNRLRRKWESACDAYRIACAAYYKENKTVFNTKVDNIFQKYEREKKELEALYFEGKLTRNKEVDTSLQNTCFTVDDLVFENDILEFSYTCDDLRDASLSLVFDTFSNFIETQTYPSFDGIKLKPIIKNEIQYDLGKLDWNFANSSLKVHVYVSENNGERIEVATIDIKNNPQRA